MRVSNMKLHKNPSSECRVHVSGQTDRWTNGRAWWR